MINKMSFPLTFDAYFTGMYIIIMSNIQNFEVYIKLLNIINGKFSVVHFVEEFIGIVTLPNLV